MPTTTITKTCAWILKQAPLLHGGAPAVLSCIGEADESGFCPVHRTPPAPVPPPAPRPKRDLDADVLPWSASDQGVFDAARGKR